MKDQYDFLKAIDTSSSSPELKEPEQVDEVVHEPSKRTASSGASIRQARGSTSASSGSEGNNNNNKLSTSRLDRATSSAGLIKSKLQNLVRPKKFHQQQQQLATNSTSKSSSALRQQQTAIAQQEDDDDDDNDDEDEDDDDDEAAEVLVAKEDAKPPQQRRLFFTSTRVNPGDSKQQLRVPISLQQQQQQQPIVKQQLAKRPGHRQQQLIGLSLDRRHHLIQSPHMTAQRPQLTQAPNGSKTTTAPSNYLPALSENNKQTIAKTTSASHSKAMPELARCYDELDQIYDYIRGLAPLPANLRKLKSIDFEQLEREHQRQQAQAQAQAQLQQLKLEASQEKQQVHHQHRQRYVKTIDSSSRSSSTAAAPTSSSGAPVSRTATNSQPIKKLVKVRQRVVADPVRDRDSIKPPPTITSSTASKLKDTLQFLVPMPIRVTTKSSESQQPSIKRVESLNLGSSSAGQQTPNSRTTDLKPLIRPQVYQSKPSYLISTSQRGQPFRLPRAHSTSTLNRPLLESASKLSKPTKQTPQEPIIQENFPLARLSPAARLQCAVAYHANHQTGSLGRPKKRSSFESDLVESYVDDDDDLLDEVGSRKPNAAAKSKSSSSSSCRQEEEEQSSRSSLEDQSSNSDRWFESYASKNHHQRTGEDKSHSDYDNEDPDEDSSQTSESTPSESANESSNSQSTATTTTTTSGEEHEELDSQSNRDLARRSCKTSSKRSHPQRPTTSSSPSSGRPASLADETNESDELESSVAMSSRRRHHSHRKLQGPQVAREEHIYEQIPAHKNVAGPPQEIAKARPQPALTSRRASAGNSSPRAPPTAAINHPVAYAANVAVNRRYQQQVAALFALQQQRDRHHQQLIRHGNNKLPLAHAPAPDYRHSSHQHRHHLPTTSHQRRASASSTQFIAETMSQPQPISISSLKWKHQPARELADVPHRQRFSMGNIHLLSGAIPLASLYSPTTSSSSKPRSIDPSARSKRERSSKNTQNSLDDQEAGSTGTTNSTSSYEAAIKNSEPNPLRLDMASDMTDQSRHHKPPSSKRSIGSGSGSRSLTNQTPQSLHSSNTQQQHQTSTLMKVPKLSKQSHLLQRPLPMPPTYRASASGGAGGGGGHPSNRRQSSSSLKHNLSRPSAVLDAFN